MNKCTRKVYALHSLFFDPNSSSGRRFRYNVKFTDWITADPKRWLFYSLNCQSCDACLMNRANEWGLRAQHEMKFHHATSFVTLTYDNDNLPFGRTLVKRHYQNFLKNLRYWYPDMSYMLCGEYGSKRGRPHYHALLFGVDFPDQTFFEKRGSFPVFTSDRLSQSWGRKGLAVVSPASYETAAYIARYTLKKREHRFSKGGILVPEFFQPSLKRSIGKDFFFSFHSDCFPTGYLIKDGFKVPVPRYYRKLYERHFPTQFRQFKIDQTVSNIERIEEIFAEDVLRTESYNESVDIIQKQQFNKLIRYIETAVDTA
jgi:hypothetical protein